MLRSEPVHRDGARLRRQRRGRASGPRPRSRCCTTPFSSTTTSRTRATSAAGGRRCTRCTACRPRSTSATRSRILSLRPLLDNRASLGPRVALRILEETDARRASRSKGQAIELGWRRDNVLDLDDADYLRMILKKTCWYTTIYPCRVGALIGTRRRPDLEPLHPLRLLPRRGVPDPGRPAQSDRRRQALRQGARRGPLGGQAHADADPSVPASDAARTRAARRPC